MIDNNNNNNSRDLLRSLDRQQHLMLLYDDEGARSTVEMDCINSGLEKGQFCVYASVEINDEDRAAKFASKIRDYDRHLRSGDLLVVDFKPYYESALAGRLDMFEELAGLIEKRIAERATAGKNIKTLIVADAAHNLTKNKHFAESARLETWWQNTFRTWAGRGLDITVICAHPSGVLKENAHDRNTLQISCEHSLVLDAGDFAGRSADKPNRTGPIRVLVVEPERDMQSVYRWAFNGLPAEAEIVGSGRQALDKVDADGAEGFDIVFIDTHLRDIAGISLAEKLVEKKPDQKIVLTTTTHEGKIRSSLAGVPQLSAVPILVKPFEFTSFLTLLNPGN